MLCKRHAEAILGLRELLEAHWELAESSLQTLISASVRVIGDEVCLLTFHIHDDQLSSFRMPEYAKAS